jgi:protein-tyrosine phosphatase
VANARDLGGVPLAPSRTVACGVVLRGPSLANLSADACADVARLGLATVVDLRSDAERVAAPDDACVGVRAVAAPLPIPYDVSPADYLTDFDTDDSIAKVFDTLADAAAYPVYLHCTFGRDRTGVVAAAVLLALGASRDDIMQEYELSAPSVGAFPDSLAAVLDEIDARGGIDAALATKGVSAADLTALRRRAAVP